MRWGVFPRSSFFLSSVNLPNLVLILGTMATHRSFMAAGPAVDALSDCHFSAHSLVIQREVSVSCHCEFQPHRALNLATGKSTQ